MVRWSVFSTNSTLVQKYLPEDPESNVDTPAFEQDPVSANWAPNDDLAIDPISGEWVTGIVEQEPVRKERVRMVRTKPIPGNSSDNPDRDAP